VGHVRAPARRNARRYIAAVAACGVLIGLLGCGADDLVFPGEIAPTATASPGATPGCLPSGDACVSSSDCCSAICTTTDGMNFFCQ
jgi:hypothetical protein